MLEEFLRSSDITFWPATLAAIVPPIQRFRAAVRLVIRNLRALKPGGNEDFQGGSEKLSLSNAVAVHLLQGFKEQLAGVLQEFRDVVASGSTIGGHATNTLRQTGGLCPAASLKVLRKPPTERQEGETTMLFEMVKEMPLFREMETTEAGAPTYF